MQQQQKEREKDELQTELSSFLKRIKQRQEEHHSLCQYTNRLLTRQQQLEQIVFIHDEIVQYQQRVRENQVFQLSQKQADQVLALKCQRVLGEVQVNGLGRRVMSRILEVTYAAVETFREFREYYSLNYARFKEKCLKIVNDGSCRPSIAVRMGSKYLAQKMNAEQERLKQAITCLELNSYESFGHLRSTYYEVLARKQYSFAVRRQFIIPVEKEESPRLLSFKTGLRKQNSAVLDKESKKDIRVRPKAKSTKQDEKARQKQKKAEAKRLKRIAMNLWEVMDICKEDLLEDLAPQTNKEWEVKRLLGGLVARNKVNQCHISTFLDQEQKYHEVTSKPLPCGTTELQRCHTLERQLLEKDDDDVEIIQNSFTSKTIKYHENAKKNGVSVKRRESLRAVPLSGNNKPAYRHQRATVNNIEEFDQRKRDKPIFSSHKQIHIDQTTDTGLKGTLKLPKARFPEISARAATLSKKNVQRRQEQQEQSSPLRTKLEIKSNSTYFDEIEKRIMKFCQQKKNLVT